MKKLNRKASKSKAKSRPVKLMLETLEARDLFSVNLLGDPMWTPQGPTGINFNDSRLDPSNNNFARDPVNGDFVIGAMSAAAVDPNDASGNTLLAGAAGGGIWRSTDNGQHWTPEIDQFGSIFVTNIAFSPLNPNVVFASTGNVSSSYPGDFTKFSTQANGVLRSNDDGVTWAQLNPADFNGKRLTRIVPTADTDPMTHQQILLAAAMDGGGIYRSSNGGNSWTSVVSGDAAGNTLNAFSFANFGADLVRDPVHNGTYFASIPGKGGGIYRLDNDGATVTALDAGGSGIDTDISGSDRVLLSLHSTNADFALYAEVISGGHLTNLYRSTDARTAAANAATWTAVANAQDPFRGGQGNLHGALLADPNSDHVVYVSGDAIQIYPFTGILYQVDATAGSWTPLALIKDNATTLTAGLTKSAADATVHVADASKVPNGRIIQIDSELMQVTAVDTMNNTLTVTRAVNGSTLASHPQAYTSGPNQVILITNGANNTGPHADSRVMVWHNGNILQGNDGGLYELSGLGGTPTWSSKMGNLATSQFISGALDPVHHSIIAGAQDNSTNFLVNGTNGNLTWNGAQVSGDGQLVAVDQSADPQHYVSTQNLGQFQRFQLSTDGSGNNSIVNRHVLLLNVTGTGQNLHQIGGLFFTTTWALNNAASAQSDLIIGTQTLYESTDQGDDLTQLAPVDSKNNAITLSSQVSAIAYGGVSGGMDNPGVLYVGTTGGQLLLRTGAVGSNTFADIAPANLTGVQAIALDPTDWHVAAVVTQTKVWFTTDAGGHWSEITGGLNDKDLLSAAIVNLSGTRAILVGGSIGLYRTLAPNDGSTVWTQYGQNLPDVPVSQVHYYSGADTLLVSTFGRGVWEVTSASNTLTTASELDINENTTALRHDANNPLQLDVFENKGTDTSGTPDATYKLSSISKIVVTGMGTNDALVIDSTSPVSSAVGDGSDGGISVPGGISFIGTGNNSQVGFQGQTFKSIEFLSAVPFANGNITSNGTTVAYSNTQTVDDLNVAASFIYSATGANDDINIVDGQSISPAQVTQINSGPGHTFLAVNFANKTAARVNALGGDDQIALNNPNPAAGLTSLVIDGGTGNNTLTGPNQAVTWNITGANAGNLGGVAVPTSFQSIQNLTGGSAVDTFVLAGGSISGVIDGGGGNNKLTGPNADTVWNVTGPNAGNVVGLVNSFVHIPNLTGGSGADKFVFSDGATIAGVLDGGAGFNKLDYSAYQTPRNVTLTSPDAGTGFNGTEASVGGGFQNIDRIIASGFAASTTDTLTGLSNANATWALAASGANVYTDNDSNTHSLQFSNFKNLTGGALADDFVFSNGATIAGVIEGGGGANTLDFSAYATGRSVTLNGLGALNNGFSGTEGAIGKGFTDIDHLFGSASATTDLLTGGTFNALWSLTKGVDAYTDMGSGHLLDFSNFENLTGGSLKDDFTFSDGATIAGVIDGGGGLDTLDYSAYTTSVVATLTDVGSTDGFAGQATGVGQTFTNIDSIDGGKASDTINGLNRPSSWDIDAQSLYVSSGRVLFFRDFETVNGGSQLDTFTVTGVAFPITLNGNGGDDMFHVLNVTNIKAALTVNGGGQAGDSLFVDDRAGTAPRTVTVVATQVGATPGDSFFGPGGLLNYFAIQSLHLLGGGFGNTVNLWSKLVPMSFDLDTGAGNDVVNVFVSPDSNYLNVLVDGEGGSNTLRMFDVVGGAVIHNIPGGGGLGDVMAAYLTGTKSFIDYQNIGVVFTNPDADHSFVQALYHQFLQRNGTQAETDAWVNALNITHNQALVADSIIQSFEAQDLVVKGWYTKYLGRPAVGGEETTWANLLQQGFSEERVLATLLGSPEYFFRAGGTDVGFVQQLFQDGLGRPASSGEVFDYVQAIESEPGRGGAAFAVFNSIEGRGDFILDLYLHELDRALVAPPGVRFPGFINRALPTQDEIQAWVFSGLDETGLREAFAASKEFFDRAF